MQLRVLLAAGLMLICSPAAADHAAKVDELVKPLLEAEAMVGCVIGIVDHGQQELHAYGEVRRGSGQKPDGNTIYEIGSVTKAFTGTLLADMIERGIVKLDTPLQELLPKEIQPPAAKDQPITLLHLATHTSGLPRLPGNMAPKVPANPYADYSADLLYAFLDGYQPPRPPGEYEYSNLGMGLLGHVLARHENRSYEELVVERICEPLGMNDTRISLTDQQRKRLAPPYDAGLGEAKNWDLNALAGAGGLRSTAIDLLKLLSAVLADADDQRPVVRAIRTACEQRHGKPGEIGIGLGWHVARDGTTRWHNGQTGGYSAALFAVRPKRLGVVVLSNTATDLTTVLAERITQAALGIPTEPINVRKAIDVAPEVLKKYEGTYALSLLFAITITEEDGKLMAQATGQNKFELFPESPTEFFYKVVNAQITFVEGDDGQVSKLILHQGGRDLPGMKLPTARDASP